MCAGRKAIRTVRADSSFFFARRKMRGRRLREIRDLRLRGADILPFSMRTMCGILRSLQKSLLFLHKRKAGFVFSAYEFGDEEAVPTGKVVHVPPVLTYKEALSRTVIFTTTVLLDREKITDELIKMPPVESEDTATWWNILRSGHKAYGLDETLAIYRRPTKSLSSNKIKALRRIWNLYRRQEGFSVPGAFDTLFHGLSGLF